MPRKKKTSAPSGPAAGQEIVDKMQDMFPHLDPDVLYMVLSERDFKVENAMDTLLELSHAAESAAPISGFDSAAALLGPKPLEEDTSSAQVEDWRLEGQTSHTEGLDEDGTCLTADFDDLIDKELEAISRQQNALASPTSSSSSPPMETQQAIYCPSPSNSSSPIGQHSLAGALTQQETPGQITAEPKQPSLDLGFQGRPSAFQAYKKNVGPVPKHRHIVPGDPVEGVVRGPMISPLVWNAQAIELKPRFVAPTFITPVVTPLTWTIQPRSQWFGHTLATQPPLKPAATVPKSWTTSPKANMQLQKMSGKVLVLMRGAPGSGKSTLARGILEQNPTGVVLSTDDYFCQNRTYVFDQAQLSVAHEWNQLRAKMAFADGVSPIIIDNTNMQAWEMKPYVAQAVKYKYKIMFREPDTWWKNKPKELERRSKHGVERDKIRRMLDRYERHVSVDSVLCSFQKPQEQSPTVTPPDHGGSLSQPSTYDLRPDVVEEPHLSLVTPEAKHQLSSSLPHVSSVGSASTKDREYSSSSNSANMSPLEVPNQDQQNDDLEMPCELGWQRAEGPSLSSGRELKTEAEYVCMENQSNDQPVAFSESIGQRVRGNRESRKINKSCKVGSHQGSPSSSFVDSRTDDECGTKDNRNPELLHFEGDWPSQIPAPQEQRSRSVRTKNKEGCLEEQATSPTEKIDDTDSSNLKACQKTLDLLQGWPESQTQKGLVLDLTSSSVDCTLQSHFEDLKLEVQPVSVGFQGLVATSRQVQTQHLGKEGNSINELLNSKVNWEGTDGDLSEDCKVEEVTIVTADAGNQQQDELLVMTASLSSKFEMRMGLHTGNSNECRCPSANNTETPGSLGSADVADSNSNAEDSGHASSQERKQRSSRRSGKHCKLALTFTNNSPTSLKPQLESPQGVPQIDLQLDTEVASEIKGSDCMTQTYPQDFALVWRINQQCPEKTADSMVKVLDGNTTRFFPMLFECSELPDKQEIPYRVVHDKGSQVEECELKIRNDKLENLQILSRHFKLVSFDTLEDLYEKCHQDMEWTTNLLLDSGEQLFKDDEDGIFKGDASLPDPCDTDVMKSEEIPFNFAFAAGEQPIDQCVVELVYDSHKDIVCITDVGKPNPKDKTVGLDAVANITPPLGEHFVNNLPEHDTMTPCQIDSQRAETVEDKLDITGGLEQGVLVGELEEILPEQKEPDLLQENFGDIGGDQLIKNTTNQFLLEQLMELQRIEKEDVQKKKEQENDKSKTKQYSSSVNIETLELKLPAELALQLSELFGPVGIDTGSMCADDYAIQIDLNLACLLHQKWKDTVQERLRQEALSYHLLQQSSVHWGESQAANSKVVDGTPSFLFGSDGLASLLKSNDMEELPFMDHWNICQPHVSLRDIMTEEEALQKNMEKFRSGIESERKHGSTLLKENQLYKMFPAIDRHFLKDIFRDNNYSLEKTEQFLRSLLDDGPVKTVVAPKKTNHCERDRSCSRERNCKPKEPEAASAQFQDTVEPAYDDFRAEAVLQRQKQRECFAKANEAFRRGMKDVASFYVQQAHLHSQKMKEANHRAAVQIFERVNASLLPQNILDLHGLHVDEALFHLRKVLEDKSTEWQKGGGQPQLRIITGRGNHSQGGVARIRPVVIDYLRYHSYRFTEPHLGLVLVTLH